MAMLNNQRVNSPIFTAQPCCRATEFGTQALQRRAHLWVAAEGDELQDAAQRVVGLRDGHEFPERKGMHHP